MKAFKAFIKPFEAAQAAGLFKYVWLFLLPPGTNGLSKFKQIN